jgi:two-component system chemotaxis response regulator CheY
MTDKNIKILIVDDFATLRMSLKSVLEQLGYPEMDEAKDGQEAIDKLKEKDYDLIISDIDMPVMNGFELLDYAKKNDNLKNIPVIFITAEAEREKIVESIKAGLDAYITKPFSISTLQQKIENIFNPEQ